MEKIVVLAGNREQFQYWLRNNIIPLTCKRDMEKLEGIKVSDVYTEGNFGEWFDAKCSAILNLRKK